MSSPPGYAAARCVAAETHFTEYTRLGFILSFAIHLLSKYLFVSLYYETQMLQIATFYLHFMPGRKHSIYLLINCLHGLYEMKLYKYKLTVLNEASLLFCVSSKHTSNF